MNLTQETVCFLCKSNAQDAESNCVTCSFPIVAKLISSQTHFFIDESNLICSSGLIARNRNLSLFDSLANLNPQPMVARFPCDMAKVYFSKQRHLNGSRYVFLLNVLNLKNKQNEANLKLCLPVSFLKISNLALHRLGTV